MENRNVYADHRTIWIVISGIVDCVAYRAAHYTRDWIREKDTKKKTLAYNTARDNVCWQLFVILNESEVIENLLQLHSIRKPENVALYANFSCFFSFFLLIPCFHTCDACVWCIIMLIFYFFVICNVFSE